MKTIKIKLTSDEKKIYQDSYFIDKDENLDLCPSQIKKIFGVDRNQSVCMKVSQEEHFGAVQIRLRKEKFTNKVLWTSSLIHSPRGLFSDNTEHWILSHLPLTYTTQTFWVSMTPCKD